MTDELQIAKRHLASRTLMTLLVVQMFQM